MKSKELLLEIYLKFGIVLILLVCIFSCIWADRKTNEIKKETQAIFDKLMKDKCLMYADESDTYAMNCVCYWLETLNTKTRLVTQHGNCLTHRSFSGMDCQKHEGEYCQDGIWKKYNEN